MNTAFLEKPAVVWGRWPESKQAKQLSVLNLPEVIDLTGDDSDGEGSTHTLLDSDLDDPYAVSDTDAPFTGYKGPYPSAAQDYEYWQMMEDNKAIKNYVYEPGVQYSSALIESLKRPFSELIAVDELDKRSRSSFLLTDAMYGPDAVLGETVPDLNERADRLAKDVELSKEEADYVLHCWDFPGMDGYSLFELDNWYVSAETIHRHNGQYYGTPIGGRKQVRLGYKFPIHHIHPEHREDVNAVLVDYDKHRNE